MAKEVDKLLASLREENSLKVWSLIITFIGDAVAGRGGNVSAKTVQSVLSGMQVGSGAVRTAFSRLVADQWIVRQKIGRESFYELAEDGYRPFKQASVRIYAPVSNPTVKSESWTLAVKSNGAGLIVSDPLEKGVQISAGTWLFKGLKADEIEALRDDQFLVMTGEPGNFPQWITTKIMPEELAAGYRQLQERFSIISNADNLSSLDSLVVRCLLIHQWRRLLLRSPSLSDELLPAQTQCRQFVADYYHQLLPRSEAWLDDCASCADGRLPVAIDDTKQRFTQQFERNCFLPDA